MLTKQGGKKNIELEHIQKLLDWLKTKLYLDSIVQNARTRTIKRGQVYRCNFGCGIGSEIQKERPALIIQNNIANLRSDNTIVISITHDNSTLPCVASITPHIDSMSTTILDGQANTSNLMCLSKARLKDYICSLPMSDMKKIDKAIAKTVGLFSYYLDLTN